MIRRIGHIVLLLLMFGCAAPEMSEEKSVAYSEDYAEESSGIEEELEIEYATEEMYAETFESIEETDDVENDIKLSVSVEEADAYNVRVEQKVRDWVDYLNILSNDEYDKEMRKSARDMIVDLFVDGATVNAKEFIGVVEEMSLEKFLKKVLKSDLSLEQFSIDRIDNYNPLRENVSSGILYVYLNDTNDKSVSLAFTFTVQQQEKIFGNDTQMVKGVYFTAIE